MQNRHENYKGGLRQPSFINEASQLDTILKTYSPQKLEKMMHISKSLAQKTHELINDWNNEPNNQTPAIDAFIGDIYRGLDIKKFNSSDRQYADDVLIILSGLYGGLRALDGICPYRLELAYSLKGRNFSNLYDFWQDKIAKLLPVEEKIINLASLEYFKAISPFIDSKRVLSPRFLTKQNSSKGPVFVTIHAKVARGAFASWMIRDRIKISDIKSFSELSYEYDQVMSTETQPTFIFRP
jgi:cytoplasmic iron level regulating protein YaaA (DUF328/UPF0246 family)